MYELSVSDKFSRYRRGRFVMITQKRRTAGIRIIGDGVNLHLDHGPGALVHSIDEGLNP